jgi:hypothetical protein
MNDSQASSSAPGASHFRKPSLGQQLVKEAADVPDDRPAARPDRSVEAADVAHRGNNCCPAAFVIRRRAHLIDLPVQVADQRFIRDGVGVLDEPGSLLAPGRATGSPPRVRQS